MTRRTPAREPARASAAARDPYGLGPARPYVAPAIALLALALVGVVTLSLMNGQLPFKSSSGGGGGGGDNGPDRTPAPSNVVIVEPDVTFPGSMVYAKAGNIWIQTNEAAKQLTSSGGDSMPSWSPDGQSIYYIRSTNEDGFWPFKGGPPNHYALSVPHLMRVPADGSAEPEELATGFVKDGRLKWSAWMRQPVLSPDGKTIALVTDAPHPDDSNVVLQLYDLQRKRLTRTGVKEVGVLGHQDPEWRPDGKYLLYTMNNRDGARGSPVIMRFDPKAKEARPLTTAGYMQPSYSPDGRYIAATRTNTLGTDVVILNASNGNELLRITNDDASWAPSWSPAGDAIAFLHIAGQTVDLRLAKLDGTGPTWTVAGTENLTEVSGLDAASRPDWYIPPALLPAAGTAAPSAASPSP